MLHRLSGPAPRGSGSKGLRTNFYIGWATDCRFQRFLGRWGDLRSRWCGVRRPAHNIEDPRTTLKAGVQH